ncbi:transcription factor HAC1 [Kluyveromyces lactis]|uniref:KLLA0F08976p n=1 Tax=Kluyveromyces lactis (strain ATCC 8585 / CBS 2359 / DSM 70799 / NBRC 1267 / NRRL Y-1140 / WM37) TaxID=284590 RepID=Q6CKQ1_KLULA|nr:uncharacterized protein KLLA0_F08976g [Kluyveromyces lactis]CAG98196.1 KLLA0F08976p [Kluyveromyces lactis]|eukprot:XP_455488.1 uncharacterized protein KLLA0_F08976g [Kluyveromyces lactis]
MTGKNSVSDIPVNFKPTLPPRKRAKTQEEKEQRRIERILRNRRAAHQSREKKRLHVQRLEEKCHLLEGILKMVDLDILSENNAKLSGMVEQWREMQVSDSGSISSHDSNTGMLDSPESLTSSPDKKDHYSHSSHSTSISSSSSSSSPSNLPHGMVTDNGMLDEDNNSLNYILGQQNYQLSSTPVVKLEEDHSMLLENNGDADLNDVGISFIAEDGTNSDNKNIDMRNQETGEGWNLLLTVPPELNSDLSELEPSDIISPIGLDTWRNPAVIVT